MLYISNIDNYTFAFSSVSADAADIESVFAKVYYAFSVSKANDSEANLVTIQNKEDGSRLVSGRNIADINLLGVVYTTKSSFCAAFNALMATAGGGGGVASDVNLKTDELGLALDATLTDGSQKTQIVGISMDDPVSGSVDLAASLHLPTSAGQRLVYGLGSVQMLSADISATTTFYLELSVDQTNWDIAVESGTDVSDTLVKAETKIVNFESTVGIYWRIRFESGNTGTVNYYTLG